MSSIRIRPARPEDAARLSALARAAYFPYVARMDREPAPMGEDYAARIAAGEVTVLEDEGVVVGFAVLENHDAALMLDNIAVDPAGQGKGYGRRLLDFTEAEARRRGYSAIELYTNEVMVENLALYRKRGYVETGRRTVAGYRRIFLRKEL
jgi:ribosomal protein S18 acetylase RimI-like enzyme